MKSRLPEQNIEKGQALVELAVGIVVLLILMAGIIDLGRLLFFSISLRDATQEGAVVGTLNPGDCQNMRIRIRSVAGSGALDTGIGVNISISKPGSPDTFTTFCNNDPPPANEWGCAPNNLKIAVSSNFTFMAPFFGGRTIPLNSEITGTILRPPCP